MKLTDFKLSEHAGTATISCLVSWENCSKPSVELYFQTQKHPLFLDPNSFLLATFLPAFHAGEKRIYVDGTISPGLIDNLYTAAAWIRSWKSQKKSLPKVYAAEFAPNSTETDGGCSGVFLSGGLDSLSTLTRVNRLYPKGSPYHPEIAVITFGTTITEHRAPEAQKPAFKKVVARIKTLTDKLGIRLVPVYTNVLEIEANIPFWMHEYHGSVFSAVAHAVSHKKATFFLASTFDIPNMAPWGSHPLVDPLYSSDRVNMIHDGVRLSRLQKAEEVTRELDDLSLLRVCNRLSHDGLNCGVCEKCVRTKLEFLVIDQPIEGLFANTAITPELIKKSVHIGSMYAASCYRDVLPILYQKNQDDLARAVRRKLTHWRRANLVSQVREKVAAFDDQWLNGYLKKIKNKF